MYQTFGGGGGGDYRLRAILFLQCTSPSPPLSPPHTHDLYIHASMYKDLIVPLYLMKIFEYRYLCIKPVLLFQTVHIWLGGLFTPEAYITATRQYVAQANNWSLEELYLDVSIT